MSETKIDESFPSAQFTLEGYEIRSRKDRDKYDGSLIEFVKIGFICKRMSQYTYDKIECICSEFNILKNKWIYFSIYRPFFFEELTNVLSKAVLKHENIIPLDETHLVVVRELIHQVSPKCVNEESSTERRSYNRQVNRSPQL